MNYYERHIGDYIRDAAHLSLLEHGIYGRLLDVYYTRECGLDESMVARWIGARTEDELRSMAVVLDEFFVLQGGVWTHRRCDEEIAKYHDKSSKARASAQASWTNRKKSAVPLQCDGSANAQQSHSDGNAHQTPDTSNQTPKSKSSAARGSRMPDDFAPDLEFAEAHGVQDPVGEFAKFGDYWRAQPGQKGVKVDWPATWRNWCRNCKPTPRQGAAPITFEAQRLAEKRARVRELTGGILGQEPGNVIDMESRNASLLG